MTAPRTLTLPARLDLTSAEALVADLRAHIGHDLTLDAGKVTHLGTPGLQVLLSARRSWAESGHLLHMSNAASGLEDQLAQMGLAMADLQSSADPASPNGE